MRRQGTIARRALAALLAAGGWLALLATGGGCEVAIGDTVPAFQCVPAAGSCPTGQECNPDTHQCVATCVAGCGAGTQCDPQSNLCVPIDAGGPDVSVVDTGTGVDVAADTTMPPVDSGPPPDTSMAETTGPCRSTGCPCSGAAACDSGICADSLTVTASLYAAAGNQNFCTTACCTSADCAPGTVCFATGQGGDYCVNPAWLGRGTGLGAGGGGATCSLGRDCRSGLCDSSGKCADTCCSSSAASQCTGGEACRFQSFPGAASVDTNYSASCGSGGGANLDGSSCSGDFSCASNLCAQDPSLGFNDCHGVCRGASDCASGESCEYVLTSQTSTPTPVVATCFGSTGTLSAGSPCSPSMDQCTGFCDQNTNKCTDVCFTDADCTAVMTGWRCRPETVSVQGGGSYSVLACGT